MTPALVHPTARITTTRVFRFAGNPMPQTLLEIEPMLSEPDGAALVGIWITLALMADKSSLRGYLLDRGGRAIDAGAIARASRTSVSMVDSTLARLIDAGVLESCRYPHRLVAVSDFIVEQCRTGSSLWVRSVELYSSYVRWCGDRHEIALDRKAFRDGMEALGFQASRSRRLNGTQARTFEGVAPVE